MIIPGWKAQNCEDRYTNQTSNCSPLSSDIRPAPYWQTPGLNGPLKHEIIIIINITIVIIINIVLPKNEMSDNSSKLVLIKSFIIYSVI